MKKLLVALTFSLTCLGCATMRTQDALNSWLGSPEEAVVAQLGIPTRTQDFTNNLRIIEYDKSTGRTAYATPIGGTVYGAERERGYSIIFTIKDGLVESAAYQPF